jgi:iron-sulfur cluster assembly protein
MTPTLPLDITQKAQQEIKNIIAEKKIPDMYSLRLGMKGASCGASFVIGFDLPQPDDLHFPQVGFTVIISKKHLMYLAGQLIDFEDGEYGLGFTFSGKEIG